MIGWITVGIILLIGSIFDIRERKVPVWLVIIALISGMGMEIFRMITANVSWWAWIIDSLPGVFALTIGFITREQLGYGDGWLLLFMGWLVGSKSTIVIIAYGLGICFAISVMLLMRKRARRNTKIPFIPLMFIGYLIVSGGRFL